MDICDQYSYNTYHILITCDDDMNSNGNLRKITGILTLNETCKGCIYLCISDIYFTSNLLLIKLYFLTLYYF